MEYKFRGKTPLWKKWKIGSLVDEEGTKFIENEKGSFVVSPETVGLFSGFKDSTGKEAFEGDLLETASGVVEICFGEYQGNRVGFYIKFIDGSDVTDNYVGLWIKESKVIGNIHDNPEQKEKAKQWNLL